MPWQPVLGQQGGRGPRVPGRSLIFSEWWVFCRTREFVLNFTHKEESPLRLSKGTSCMFPEPEDESEPPALACLEALSGETVWGPFGARNTRPLDGANAVNRTSGVGS